MNTRPTAHTLSPSAQLQAQWIQLFCLLWWGANVVHVLSIGRPDRSLITILTELSVRVAQTTLANKNPFRLWSVRPLICTAGRSDHHQRHSRCTICWHAVLSLRHHRTALSTGGAFLLGGGHVSPVRTESYCEMLSTTRFPKSLLLHIDLFPEQRLTDWLTDRLTEWLTDWLSDCLTDLVPDWLIDWLTAWLTECLTDCLTDWVTASLTDWVPDWLTTDWLTEWLTVPNWQTQHVLHVAPVPELSPAAK